MRAALVRRFTTLYARSVATDGQRARLILASASPRRRDLLRGAGFEFEVRPSSIVEARREGESGERFALRSAREKALDVARSAPAGSLVLGADTVVLAESPKGAMVLGKPEDAEEAARMLRLLSGSTHRVVTGVCLARPPDRVEALISSSTRVTFRALDEAEILDYVSSQEPFDKAGAYAIQGRASRFATRIEGDYSNVVGLPVSLVSELLKSFGLP